MESEYLVQNLSRVVLALRFPDLTAEEYTDPAVSKSPRDHPSLCLVVEVKFVRSGKRFADIVEVVVADASLHRTDPRWDMHVPFVSDESYRTVEHVARFNGLQRPPVVHDAVVVRRVLKDGPTVVTFDAKGTNC